MTCANDGFDFPNRPYWIFDECLRDGLLNVCFFWLQVALLLISSSPRCTGSTSDVDHHQALNALGIRDELLLTCQINDEDTGLRLMDIRRCPCRRYHHIGVYMTLQCMPRDSEGGMKVYPAARPIRGRTHHAFRLTDSYVNRRGWKRRR